MATSPRSKRRLDLNLDSDLKKRLLSVAYDDRRTMSAIVEDALEAWLGAREQAAPRPASLPPVTPVRPSNMPPPVRVTASGTRLPLMPPRPTGPKRVEA